MIDTFQASNIDKTLLMQHSLHHYISDILDNKSAEDTVAIDLAGKSDMADAMVIATGNSTTHIGALARHVVRGLQQAGVEVISVAGTPDNRWVLVDSAEVIVHIFHSEERELYGLEKMWAADFVAEEEPELLH